MAMSEMERFIRQYAASVGLNPEPIMRTVLNEGGRQSLQPEGYTRQSNVVSGGVREPSYGPFQMHMKYLGGRAKAAGYDPRDPAQAFNVAKFAIDEIAKKGLGQWYGWKGDPMAAHKGGGASGITLSSVPDGPKGEEMYTPIVNDSGTSLSADGVSDTPTPESESQGWAAKLKSIFAEGGEGEDEGSDAGDLVEAVTGKDKDAQKPQLDMSTQSILPQMEGADAARIQSAQSLMSQIMQKKRQRGLSLTGVSNGIV